MITGTSTRELSAREIEIVSGGSVAPGFRMADGSGFTWIGPNGIPYENVTFVGSHFFTVDGFNEFYSDIFHISTWPLPSLQGFLNTITFAGSVPVFVNPPRMK